MRPRTKIEREATRLSAKLPPISDNQKRNAMKLVSIENARIFRGKKTDIAHFILATTKNGWQVLRHFYLYATYRRGNLNGTEFAEVMQQWFNGGKYVFFSRSRQGIGYCNDAWCMGSPLQIRRGPLGGGVLIDPRGIGYDKVIYVRLADRFRYVDRDEHCDHRVDNMFRALNTHPFNETLYKYYKKEWLWSLENGFVYDKELISAVKVAMRHKYNFMNEEWKDLVEMLVYLRKDTHNPRFVCPIDIHITHDEITRQAARKRQKEYEKKEKMMQVRRERQELMRLEREARAERERKKTEKAMANIYPKKRGKFFSLVISDGDLEIRVLQTVEEFMREGAEMGHCVFANAYFDLQKKPDSLILSAKASGKRVETIEVDLKSYKVVQCQGKSNQNSPYHTRILNLMSENMDSIRRLNG